MSSRALVPKSRLSSGERRASIVRAACKLFSERGFRGTTTRELALAVGVTEPVLYEHFKTKRDLYNAIIEGVASQGLTLLAALSAKYRDANDDRGFFRELATSILDWYTKDQTVTRLLLFSNLENHELKELFHETAITCFSEVSRYIQARIDAGAFRAVDAEVAARAFFGMVAHYAQSGVLFGCAPFSKPLHEVITDMVDIFVAGVTLHTPASADGQGKIR